MDEIRDAYNFSDLQTFLDIYYAGAQVLRTAQDFYDLTSAYLKRAAQDNVRHVEIFFDPQTHTERDVEFATVIDGIYGALQDGQSQLGITFRLIMCFLRHLSAEAAMATLEEALLFKEKFTRLAWTRPKPGIHRPSSCASLIELERKVS